MRPAQVRLERVDYARVELRAAAAVELLQGLRGGTPATVRAVGEHRLEGVGDGDDPGLERDLLAPQPEGVAVTVEPFVVSQDRGTQVGEAGTAEQTSADLRVVADLGPLVVVERPVLEQDRVGHPDLADVVQHAGEPNALRPVIREAELARHALGVAADGLGVAGGARVAQVERLRERQQRGQVRGPDGVAGGTGRERADDLAAVDHGAVAAEGLGGVERLVGAAQQPLRRLAVLRIRGDPEAHRQPWMAGLTASRTRWRSRSAVT